MTRTRFLRSLFLAASAALVCFVLAPVAHAGRWNERTLVTFSGPVEVPGHVLPAGTYSFQIMNSTSTQNVVEIYNKNRTKLYALILANPAYRMQPTGQTVFTWAERPSDTPEALSKWFYPGRIYGVKFIYPQSNVEISEAHVSKTLPTQG